MNLPQSQRQSASSARFALALLAVTLLFASSSHAQWTVRQAPAGNWIKFLDEAGHGEIGFIGNAGKLYRSQDSGYVWDSVNVPFLQNESLRDITFKDDQIGWLAGNKATYKTTDGGRNWKVMFLGNATSVHYAPATSLLFVSMWNMAARMSPDEGDTWEDFGPSLMNGYAAIDDQHMIYTPRTGSTRYSTDGGITWENSDMHTEAWQPVALKQHKWYVAVCEKTGEVMRSKDLGRTWSLISTLPMSSTQGPTGCVRGDDDNILASTFTGLYRSTDQGETWVEICGPDADFDTRFWVRGSEIYAMSYHGVLMYNRNSLVEGHNNWINFTPDTVAITTDGCTIAGQQIVINVPACYADVLSLSMEGDTEFTLRTDTTRWVRGQLYLLVEYRPTDLVPDTGAVRIRLAYGKTIIDTTVFVYSKLGNSLAIHYSPRQLSMMMNGDCTSDEAVAGIANRSCRPLRIDSLRLEDPIHFEIFGINVPMTLNGGLTQQIRVRGKLMTEVEHVSTLYVYLSNGTERQTLEFDLKLTGVKGTPSVLTDKRVDFAIPCDSINSTLDFRNNLCDAVLIDSVVYSNPSLVTSGAVVFPVSVAKDNTYKIPFAVFAPKSGSGTSKVTVYFRLRGRPLYQSTFIYSSSSISLGLAADTVKFKTSTDCPAFDSVFYITNPLCDPMTITRLSPALQPMYTFDLPTLPITLQPKESIAIGVHTNLYKISASSTSMQIAYEALGKTLDTTVHVRLQRVKEFKIDPKLKNVAFGKTSTCAAKRQTIYINNFYCVGISLDRAQWTTASDVQFKTIYQPTLPRALAPGERDSIVIEFAPDRTGVANGAMQVRLTSDVVLLDTFFTVNGIGSGSVNAGIRDDQLAFGTGTTCERLRSSTIVSNDGCEPMDLLSITIANGNFSLVAPALPHHLEPGASVELVFETASAASGLINSQAQVLLLSKQNLEQILTCELSAQIAKEIPHVLAASMDVGQHSECAPIDSSIVVVNPSECEDMTVQAAFTSPNATLTGSNSALIPAGGSATFTYRITPNPNASVTLRLFADGMDTTVSINYAFVAGGGSLVLNAPTSTFETNACDVLLKPVTISNTSCSPLEVTNISLTPYTRFAIDGSWTYPILIPANESFMFNVRFDPKAIGANVATLEVTEKSGKILNSVLTGAFTPPQVLSAGITSAGMQEVIVGDELEVDLSMTQDVASPIAIDELIAQFAFDTDILTLVRVEPGTDWAITSNQPISGGAALGLSHTASTYTSGDRIATLVFRSTLAKDNSGTVTLQGLKINPADPEFAECVASLAFIPSGSEVTVKYFCGGETLRSALAGELPVKNIRVRPHPASSSDHSLVVSFESAQEVEMALELVNVLGVVCGRMEVQSQSGLNELTLPLSGTSSGWHLLRICSALGTAGIRVLLVD